jgi:hypothetical protein
VVQPPPGVQGRRRNRSWIVAAVLGALLIFLLVGAGALALNGFGGSGGLLGGAGSPPHSSRTPHAPNDGSKAPPSHAATPNSSAPGEKTVDLSHDTSPPAEPTTTQSASPQPGPNGSGSQDPEVQGEQAARDYYDAAENGEWKYTYRHLYYPDKQRYTYDQWVTINENAGTASATFQIDAVQAVDTKLGAPAVQVALTVYAADGTSFTRTTHFYLIDGLWEHVLTDEERAGFDANL